MMLQNLADARRELAGHDVLSVYIAADEHDPTERRSWRMRLTARLDAVGGSIDASAHDPCVAYVAGNRFQLDDDRPYLWKTANCGTSWTRIDALDPDLTEGSADPVSPNGEYRIPAPREQVWEMAPHWTTSGIPSLGTPADRPQARRQSCRGRPDTHGDAHEVLG